MFVKHKLNIKPSKKPIQQLVQIQDMEYTFRESMPKSNFYNESILNSSKEIPFYETKMIPFLKESKVSINGEKNKNLLDSSGSISHLSLSSSNESNLLRHHMTTS